MYVGLGALSAHTEASVRQNLPGCYTQELHDCLQEENQNSSECRKYQLINAAYVEDFDATEEIVDQLNYCSEREMWTRNLLFAACGAGLGFVVASFALLMR